MTVRRWRFDHDGWAGTRAAIALPRDVAEGLPRVPDLTAHPAAPGRATGEDTTGPAATAPPAVTATRTALTAALTVATTAPVAVHVVRRRGGAASVSRYGCAGAAAAGMTVATQPGAVAVEVEMTTTEQLVAVVRARLAPPTTGAGPDTEIAVAGTWTVTPTTLATGAGLPRPVWRALGGDGASADHDLVVLDGPLGSSTAALVRTPAGTPLWVRAEGTDLQVRATTDDDVRAWLVRALAAQLGAVLAVAS